MKLLQILDGTPFGHAVNLAHRPILMGCDKGHVTYKTVHRKELYNEHEFLRNVKKLRCALCPGKELEDAHSSGD